MFLSNFSIRQPVTTLAIIIRVERPFQSIPRVYEMFSTASESNANFPIFFDFGKDMSEAGDDTRNAIASVRYKLPIEMREPVLYRRDISSEPIVQLGLSSTKQTHAQISRLAEDVLADQFRGIPGVAVVN